MAPMQRINVMLDEATLARLAEWETITGATRSELLRRAVAAFDPFAGRPTKKTGRPRARKARRRP